MVKAAQITTVYFTEIELPRRTFPACHALRPRSISLLRDRAMFVSYYSTAMLAIESCNVISLRLTKLMDGTRESHEEARLMVSEKVNAMFEAGVSLMAGGTASGVVDRYREHVAANARRLSR
jgi:2-iminoacetate synthase ThiH